MALSGLYRGQVYGAFERPLAGFFAKAAQAPERYRLMDASRAVLASLLASTAVCHTILISAPCQAPLSGFRVRRMLGKSAKYR